MCKTPKSPFVKSLEPIQYKVVYIWNKLGKSTIAAAKETYRFSSFRLAFSPLAINILITHDRFTLPISMNILLDFQFWILHRVFIYYFFLLFFLKLDLGLYLRYAARRINLNSFRFITEKIVYNLCSWKKHGHI